MGNTKTITTSIKLSIITVNLNNAIGLKETAQSIQRLKYQYHEWLVIDGASTDSSLQVIQEYKNSITKFVSERDSGIYNAMNKGVRMASGNIILFLNSGDIFSENTSLDFLNEYSYSPKTILIGKSQLTTSNVIYPLTEDPIYLNKKKYFLKGQIPHQASFIPRDLLIKYPYSENLKIASDLEFILKMHFHKKIRLDFINKILTLCDENGISCEPKYQRLSFEEASNARLKYIGFYYYCYKHRNLIKKVLKYFQHPFHYILKLFQIIFKTIKFFIKFLIFITINSIIYLKKYLRNLFPVSKIILIIRPDNIGDYVLFRNMLEFLTQAPQYNGFKFWLLGNKTFSNLAKSLDKQFIDKFIWINPSLFIDSNSLLQLNRKQFLHIFKINYLLVGTYFHSIIYPVYSRRKQYDKLVSNLLAINKITMTGDNVNMVNFINNFEYVYNCTISVSKEAGIFEFDRNKEFISKLINKQISLMIPNIDIQYLPKINIPLPKYYAVFHLDSSQDIKGIHEWPKQNYAQISEYLYCKYNLHVVLLGNSNRAESLASALSTIPVYNLYNQTSLSETAAILAKAFLFVGNDSGLLHIAAAVGIKRIICLCSGRYYGRFTPYPYFSNKYYFFVFPPAIDKTSQTESFIKQKYADGSYEDIKTIQIKDVFKLLDKLLAETQIQEL